MVMDDCFYSNKDMFRVAPSLDLKKLEAIFQHKVETVIPVFGALDKSLCGFFIEAFLLYVEMVLVL